MMTLLQYAYYIPLLGIIHFHLKETVEDIIVARKLQPSRIIFVTRILSDECIPLSEQTLLCCTNDIAL